MKKGRLFIFSGPSGVGKSTILHEIFAANPNLYFSVSATTRDPRPGETDGKDYHFTDVDHFRKLIEEDELLEYAEFVGNYYGTPREYVDAELAKGRDVILDIEINGAIQVRTKRPDAVSIYIAPPSWDDLENRLVGRGTDSETKVRERLARAREEFSIAHTYDYFVINRSLETAVNEVKAIMLAEHCRPDERMDLLK